MYVLERRIHVYHGENVATEPWWNSLIEDVGIPPFSDWMTFTAGDLISQAPSTKCYRCELPDQRTIYFKRYSYPLRRRHEFWLRPGKAAVEYWAYSRLKELGIPTLNVVAFGERRAFGALLASFIVTEGVDYTIDLATFVHSVWSRWPREKRRVTARAIAHRLLAQARTAHDAQFFHHDLKFRNILINPDGDPSSLVLIDAPRASRMRLRQYRGVVTDLSGLSRIAISLFSRFELMRLLHVYLGKERRAEAKRLFRSIQKHLGRRMPKPLDLTYPD